MRVGQARPELMTLVGHRQPKPADFRPASFRKSKQMCLPPTPPRRRGTMRVRAVGPKGRWEHGQHRRLRTNPEHLHGALGGPGRVVQRRLDRY
jgi:hypothetical protein